MNSLVLAFALAILPQYTLPYHVYPGETYELVRCDTLDATIWTGTRCGQTACDSFTYSPAPGVVEQVRMRINGERLTHKRWTLLTLDWSGGSNNPYPYYGQGGMQYTLVTVILPSPKWSVVYSFREAIPTYVKATCDQDYTHDGVVNLSDLVALARKWNWQMPPLSEFATFGRDYGQRTKEWR